MKGAKVTALKKAYQEVLCAPTAILVSAETKAAEAAAAAAAEEETVAAAAIQKAAAAEVAATAQATDTAAPKEAKGYRKRVTKKGNKVT